MKIKLKDIDGNIYLDCDYADSLKSLPLANYCDFLPLAEEYTKLEDDDSPETEIERIQLLCKMVSAWSGVNYEAISKVPITDDNNSLEASLMTLFAVSMKAINNYHPKTKDMFSYRGEWYFINLKHREQLGQNAYTLSTQEAVEVLDLQRKLTNVEAAPADKLFHLYLEQLAILCNKQGEDLPDDDVQTRMIINNRREHFAGDEENNSVSTVDALDVDFFFGSRLGLLSRTMKQSFSSIPLRGLLTA